MTGLENLPRGNAVILFNHTSYMDAVIIASVLPGEPAFVAKKEFADQPFAGSFMRRLGVAFVERFDAAASLADAEAVTGMAKDGPAVRVLPGRHVHAPRRPARLLHGRVQGRGGSEPAGRAGHAARRAHAVARRSVVPAPHADRRRDRGADPAGRHRLYRDAGAARRRPRRDAQARRRAGSRRAGKAAGAGGPDDNLRFINGFKPCSRRIERISCRRLLRRPYPLYYSERSAKAARIDVEEIMAWTTPTLVEICIGLEINGYLPAEF